MLVAGRTLKRPPTLVKMASMSGAVHKGHRHGLLSSKGAPKKQSEIHSDKAGRRRSIKSHALAIGAISAMKRASSTAKLHRTSLRRMSMMLAEA